MPDEILREGDEYYSVNHCCFNATGDCGLPANHEGGAGPYRRRVTPVEQPLGACLDEENNELREQVATLTAEVERLRLTREERIAIAFFRDEAFENYQKRYRSELGKLLERLGGAE
jgi:FtsZ-binding cell division protein ZapB